jgi:hypothetical protein
MANDPFTKLPAPSTSGSDSKPGTDPEFVSNRVKLLIGCYPKGQVENSDVYVSAIATVLARYPQAVVMSVTDPFNGLPAQCGWLPTIAEVKAACERLMEPARREAARYRAARDTQTLIAPTPMADGELERIAAHWQQVRPTLAAPDNAPAPEPFEQAVERLRSRAREPVVISTKALQAKLEAMGAQFEPRTFAGGRAVNTPFDIPPDESLKPGKAAE